MSKGIHETVFEQVLGWLEAGQRVWLCTIVQTWGSSPRPAGSWLAVSSDGNWAGSVSGGCLEQDLLERCIREENSAPRLIEYGIVDEDRDRFRLPCGGRILLLVEPLNPDIDRNHVAAALQSLAQRRPVQREIDLQTGRSELKSDIEGGAGVELFGQTVRHTLMPDCRLLLIGAGEVARYVSEIATASDFDVTLCEPRPHFAKGWRNETVPLRTELPDDLIVAEFSDPWCGVLALAHDPRIDDMALLAALVANPFYVGAMGSVRTSDARRQRLTELGVPEASLNRLAAPIGVDIPSKTPAEIAVSVVADLIRARHRLRQAQPSL